MTDPTTAMMDDIEFHFIELKKMKTSIEDLNDPLDIWSAFIERSDSLSEDEMEKLEDLKQAEDLPAIESKE